MKSSRWITPAFAFWCCGTAVFQGAEPSAPSPLAEKIKIQEARVPQIEAVAAREREEVEQWYRSRRAVLVQEIARPEAARLSLPLRELWVQYADAYEGRFYAPASINAGFAASYQTALLGQAMIDEYLVSRMTDLLADPEFERKLTQLMDERLDVRPFNKAERVWERVPLLRLLGRGAQELLVVVRRVQIPLSIALRQLENQRDARLDAIMEQEKKLKEQVHGILEYLRQSESRPTQFGVVASVGYCPSSGYYCMIEGVDRVVGVGDRIGSVRVLRIDPQQVEFARNGTKWAQALGAPPQPFWE